ncbi:MAG TPA: PilT/PilU family type 4a pilus ATPase [Candidatus Limnocylindrales bacterium]|nr:PilT/PilU family type 4a pilus ATPase [Candidatus Limnocylindrales bacterium]
MTVKDLLKFMVQQDASDLYLTVDAPPVYRIQGVTRPAGTQKLLPEHTEQLAYSVMNKRQQEIFEKEYEMNLALYYPDLGRFRVNIFRQRNCVGLVIRQIKMEIKTIDDLQLPAVLKNIAMAKRGLVLVVGATGSGKSTTLAAMIDYRNSNSPGHIVTIEDPVEYIHPHKKSLVTQREVGTDTLSFAHALKNTLRQAPDVILVGEIRDVETMEAAVAFAETGHLCMGTLHANNANQAIERIMNFFPAERHPQIYLQLALNLRAIISQRLVPTVDGKRTAAVEILLGTPRVQDLIQKGEVDILKEAMEQSVQEGMQSFDHALYILYKQGRIRYEDALANADSANNLRLKIKLEEVGQGASKEEVLKSTQGLKIQEDDPKSSGRLLIPRPPKK